MIHCLRGACATRHYTRFLTYITSHARQNNLRAACELAFQGLKILQAVPIWSDNFGGHALHLTCVKGLTSLFSIPRGSHFCWIVRLKITDNSEAKASALFLSKRDDIPSTPVAFLGFKSLSVFPTFEKVTAWSLKMFGFSS